MRSSEEPYDLNTIQISLASPEEIRSFSYGEVTNSKSINYKTMGPEKRGIFCEVIFGPLKDYECHCGALHGIEYEGRICQSCGVEVNSSRVRRYRMGHIELASPIAHLWFFKVRPFYLSTFLGIRLKDLEQILSSTQEVILQINQKKFPAKKPYLYENAKVLSGTGHEVLYRYLQSIDLVQEYSYQKSMLFNLFIDKKPLFVERHEANKKFISSETFILELKRFKLIQSFLGNKRRPEWMMFTTLPVLPPELRPFIIMPNNLIVSSDLNLLYKKILDRNKRLRSLKQLSKEYSSAFVTSSFVYNELSMLQHSIDSLIENGRRGKALLNKKRFPLKSLAQILKGKEGRFRMNLLGKRVDLSGRTVISVGPRLKLTQCGLPILVAIHLFQSFIYKKLAGYGSKSIGKDKHFDGVVGFSINAQSNLAINRNLRLSTPIRKVLNAQSDYVFSTELLSEIEKIVYAHPVLLNRAPTLHRLNVQAFQPLLLNNKAIQLHPLVCSSFNADFDGDQMAIHVPLSLSSQIESRILMMTYNNIISPSNGSVIISPSQDVIFGIYYATTEKSEVNQIRHFSKIEDIKKSLSRKEVSLHTSIRFKIKNQWKVTTPGRLFFYFLLPHTNSGIDDPVGLEFDIFNTVLTKKKIQELLRIAHDRCTKEDFLYFLDQVMAYGFYYAHQAGISMCLNDIVIPSLKNRIVQNATDKSSSAVIEHKLCYISNEEKVSRVIGEWSHTQESITNTILRDVYQGVENQIPPIYMLIYSGARGSILQMRQLSGLRGLMVKPSGEVIEMPIASNFKEGLKVLEYFHSTHGARKGVIDTSIRTATSGYLTRRLVHASQSILVTEEDCGTTLGIPLKSDSYDGKESYSMYSSALGRTVARNIYKIENNELLYSRNSILDTLAIQVLNNNKIESILVRSPLTCQSKRGVCQACYGNNLSTGKRVLIGEPVGILASQSIGEPGTQLTMRTFHMGGVLQGNAQISAIYAKDKGRICFRHGSFVSIRDKINTYLCISRKTTLVLMGKQNDVLTQYEIPYGSIVYVEDGSYVQKDTLLSRWNPYYEPVFYSSPIPATIICPDLVKGFTYVSLSLDIKKLKKIITNYQTTGAKTFTNRPESKYVQELFPRLIFVDDQNHIKKETIFKDRKQYRISDVHYLLQDDICFVSNKDRVSLGSLLYLIPRASDAASDITGGLSKISQLFEFSIATANDFILAAKDGFFFPCPGRDKSRLRWKINQIGDRVEKTMNQIYLPSSTRLNIRSLRYLKKTDPITAGCPSFEEIRRVCGIGKYILQFKEEIQSIYRTNGVSIHDKHLELILSRMYSRLSLSESGQTFFILGEEIGREEFLQENIRALVKGLKLAKARVTCKGVTNISIESSSFLSAAAFQNTSLVLSKSAILGRTDKLLGLSENVILGRLCPIGAGSMH